MIEHGIKKRNLNIDIAETVPSKDDFIVLYEAATKEWESHGLYTHDQLYGAVCNNWYVVSMYHEGTLVGFGRVISDGIYQTLISDVMVLPEYQANGIGALIMNTLLDKCRESGMKWVQLISATGKKGFYEKLGFVARDVDAPGMTLNF